MLHNRVALVTGGVIGIGKAIGVQLAKNRSKVGLASPTPAYIEPAAAELKCLRLTIFRCRWMSETTATLKALIPERDSSLSVSGCSDQKVLDTDGGLQPRLLNRFRTSQGCYEPAYAVAKQQCEDNPPSAKYGRAATVFSSACASWLAE
jgi:hypothetical protein